MFQRKRNLELVSEVTIVTSLNKTSLVTVAAMTD